MLRLLFVTLTAFIFSHAAMAQTEESAPATATEEEPAPVDRSATGGAQTLEDILRRQRGEEVESTARPVPAPLNDGERASGLSGQLGTLGVLSDSDMWGNIRHDTANITVSSGGPEAAVLVQDGGMKWIAFREGPLIKYGGYLLGGTVLLLLLFFLLRGRVRIDGEKTGHTVTRFKSIERFAHWLLAGSFIVLGITGIISLIGRTYLIPAMGRENFSIFAIDSKWIHNNVSWAFMIALVLIFVMWVVHNLPSRTDITWLLKGGGLFKKGVHPPAKKFNAGQKLIFWSVIILGGSISVSGLSLLFPFQMPMFAATFEKLNALGLPALVGMGELQTSLSPHEEMQLAQSWHAIVSFVLMAIIIAHIYIGSVGMEGAFDAMDSGEVEEQWAHEHHSLWAEKVKQKEPPQTTTPAE